MRALFNAVLAITCLAATAVPGQEPSAGALAAARDMLVTKGGTTFFDPVVPGVIESVKNSLVPTHLQLYKELNDVAALLRKDYEPKRAEVLNNAARVFAQHFTEQELKDITAFYKTPLGQKMLKEEPVAIEQSLKGAQDWAKSFSETVTARFYSEMQKKGHKL
jgi:hypothetical protein